MDVGKHPPPSEMEEIQSSKPSQNEISFERRNRGPVLHTESWPDLAMGGVIYLLGGGGDDLPPGPEKWFAIFFLICIKVPGPQPLPTTHNNSGGASPPTRRVRNRGTLGQPSAKVALVP